MTRDEYLESILDAAVAPYAAHLSARGLDHLRAQLRRSVELHPDLNALFEETTPRAVPDHSFDLDTKSPFAGGAQPLGEKKQHG